MIPTYPEPTPERRSFRERLTPPAIRLSRQIAQRRLDAEFLRRLADRIEEDDHILRRLS